MANSYVLYTGDGVQTDWAVPFPYIDQDHVHIYADGVEVTVGVSWPSSGVITASPAIANGASVKVARQTPDTALVNFENRNNLTADNLSTASLQAIYRAVEAADRADDSITLADDNTWDMGNKRVNNVATPTEDDNAATKLYVDESTASIDAATITAQATAATAAAATATAAATAAAADAASIVPAQFMTKAANLGDVASVPAALTSLGISYAAAADVLAGTAAKIITADLMKKLPALVGYSNLVITVATGTTVTITADAIGLTDGAGNFLTVTGVSHTLDLSVNGAVNRLDTGTIAAAKWYKIFEIAKADGTKGCLGSLSSTPTLPTGYTLSKYIGSVQTLPASASLYGTKQIGNRAQYVLGFSGTSIAPLICNGAGGGYSATSPGPMGTFTVVGDGKHVPPTASHININVTNCYKGGALSGIMVAPNISWGGGNNGPIGSNGVVWPVFLNSSTETSVQVDIQLEALTLAYSASAAGGAMVCMGWTDTI